MKKIREETSFLLCRMGWILGAAFLFAFLGTLVWINGRGAWFIMRFGDLPIFMPSLTLSYTLWLLTYGFFGISVVLLFFSSSRGMGRCFPELGLLLLSYLLALLWHALFYSAWLPIPAFLVLIVGVAAEAVFIWRVKGRSWWLLAVSVLIFMIEVFFVVLTILCF